MFGCRFSGWVASDLRSEGNASAAIPLLCRVGLQRDMSPRLVRANPASHLDKALVDTDQFHDEMQRCVGGY